METKPPVPRAILVGIQVPSVDDVAHAASIEELGRLVKTLGYEVVATMSQKRDEIGGGTVLGKGRLEELAAITGGTGVVGSMAVLQKSKARERFENADVKKPDAPQIEADPEAPLWDRRRGALERFAISGRLACGRNRGKQRHGADAHAAIGIGE